MREILVHNNREEWLSLRLKDITSTEISALFGISPYATEFEIWHRKKNGVVDDFSLGERPEWGNRLQNAIAAGIAAEKNWLIKPFFEYARDPELRIGSSFDFSVRECGHENCTDAACLGVLEIKNVDSLIYRNTWQEEGDRIEAPLHIEMQVQHQLLVSECAFAYIGVLVGGNTLKLVRREPDAGVHQAIIEKVKDFWAMLESGIEPKPNFKMDADLISKIYGFADPGKVFDARDNERIAHLMHEYRGAAAMQREGEERKDAAKAEILTIIRDAEKVVGDGFSISAGVVAGGHVEYDRKPYRNFRPSFKKGT